MTQTHVQAVPRLPARCCSNWRCDCGHREQRRQHECPFPSGRHAEEVLWKTWGLRNLRGAFQSRLRLLFGKHCKRSGEALRALLYRANRCGSLYDDIFAIRGWKREESGGVAFELASILVEKWKGKAYRLVIQRQKCMGCEPDLWEGEYAYRCILTNDYDSSEREIVEFYNLRGGKERIFDDMNNGFGWNRLPKSFMAENTACLLLTALIHNFYKAIMQEIDTKKFGLKPTSRIKAFVFTFISVPAKWIRSAR